MPRYRISNRDSGVILGVYKSEDSLKVLDVMAVESGYKSYLNLCSVLNKTYKEARSELRVEMLPD